MSKMHLVSAAQCQHWTTGLLRDRNGTPERGLANVMHVLSQHPAWHGVLAYDEFSEAVTKLVPPPVRDQDGRAEPGEWTEDDTTRTCAWFASSVHFEPTSVHVEQAIATAAKRQRRHPVRDYLREVQWDGDPRLDTVLPRYFGSEDSHYTRAIGSRWMISAVARILRPGCQADCMLVLEGAQGAGKSTGAEALTGEDWFADTGITIGDKDSYQALRSKWVYEFGELDSLKGREVTRVKSFVSARKDTYRPSYGRRTRDFPRQVVFIGTTNEDHYLADGTGNRRFWPVRCGSRIDIAGLKRDRDQLWAEAVRRFQEGAPWHVDTPELRALCAEATAARQTEDPWLAIVGAWLRHQGRGGVTTARALEQGLEIPPGQITRAHETRIGQVLRDLGWEARQQRIDGARVRVYQPTQATSQ